MIGAPAFDNQQCGALCPILAVARALCDSLRLANYPRRSSEEKFQLHEDIRPSSRLFRRCFPSRALSNLKVIRSIRRLFRPTSASQKSARRLASSCAAPFQCCQVIAPSNGGPPVSPIRNRVAGESSNVDRFRPSYPSASNVPSSPSEPTKTAYLSWKDNSTNEDGFRVYRIVQNQMSKIAELGPNTASFVDKAAPPRACYVVVAFNSAGESPPTAKACLSD